MAGPGQPDKVLGNFIGLDGRDPDLINRLVFIKVFYKISQ